MMCRSARKPNSVYAQNIRLRTVPYPKGRADMLVLISTIITIIITITQIIRAGQEDFRFHFHV